MKQILPYIGLLALISLLEISWSGFVSFQERPYFFLFSLLAIWVVKRGFIRALPMIAFFTVFFEGIIHSTVGLVALYGVLFAYGLSFLLKRVHLEQGVERILLSLAAGIGMAGYMVFLRLVTLGFSDFPVASIFGRAFLENILIGSIFFLVAIWIHEHFREESLPLSSSFVK